MVYFVCAGHICSGLSQSEFYLHVLMTAMHTGTGPASAAPSTQRISGQETLTAGCVGRAVGHGYGSHAFRGPHIEDSLQEQRNSQPDECLTDRSGFRAQVFKSVRRSRPVHISTCTRVKARAESKTFECEQDALFADQSMNCAVYLGGGEDHALDRLRLGKELNLLDDPRTLIKQNHFVEKSRLLDSREKR